MLPGAGVIRLAGTACSLVGRSAGRLARVARTASARPRSDPLNRSSGICHSAAFEWTPLADVA